jgi:uncharacterized membrane protein
VTERAKSAGAAAIVVLLLLALIASGAGFAPYALWAAFSVYLLLERSSRKDVEAHRAALTARIYAVEEALKKTEAAANRANAETRRLTSLEPAAQNPAHQLGQPGAGTATATQAPAEPVDVPRAPVAAAPPLHSEPSEVPTEQQVPSSFANRPSARPSRVVLPPPAGRPPASTPAVDLFARVSQGERKKAGFDLETKLGANWLNKLGVVLLVMGVALFLGYELGGSPAGRVFLGYLAGVTGLGAGAWLEKRAPYRVYARSLIGGGWALLFFVTYAIHFVAATRILENEVLDLVLMLAVAGAMVWHTLRYRSQVVTGMALLLAFATVAISESTIYSLTAGAILALSLVVIVLRMGWFELEIFGVLASYLNHFWFLRRIIEPMGIHRHGFPQFWPSTALLAFYWAVFRFSYLARQAKSPDQERVSGIAALLNTSLLLAILKYQASRPEWAFWALLGLGAVEVGLAQLPQARRRRMAFVLLSTIGVALAVGAFAFRYSGWGLSVVWLLEAEALLLTGVLAGEVVYRRLGIVAAGVSAAQMLIADLLPVAERRLGSSISPAREIPFGVLFAVAAAVLYMNAHWVRERWAKLFETELDAGCLRLFSYFGCGMAAVAVWMIWPRSGTAVGWMALALAAAMAASRLRSAELANQMALLAAAAFLRALFVNLQETQDVGHLSVRLSTVGFVVLGLYVLGRPDGIRDLEWTRRFAHTFTWGASFLAALLAWMELSAPWAGLAWIALGIALGFAARQSNRKDLGLQANALAVASFLRALAVNLSETGTFHHISLRLLTVGLITIGLYVFSGWGEIEGLDWTQGLARTFTWGGSVLLSLLAWHELRPVSVAVAWGLLGLILFELGLRFKSLSLRLQGYVGFGCAFVRIFMANLNAAGAPGQASPRLYTILPLVLAFYYAYSRQEGLGRAESLDFDRRIGVARYLAYLGTITVAALLRFELEMDWVVAGWALLVFALILLAWRIHRNLFLEQGLLLTLLILARTILHNFYERSYFPAPFWYKRSMTVGAAVVTLFACVPVALRLREGLSLDPNPLAERWKKLLGFHRPEQILFFVPLGLLTALLALDMGRGKVTLAWGIEGVAVFLAALFANQRSYRISGLALLLLCVGKIAFVDVWGLDPSDRYLTLIVLGSALLLVSFLYTRYRERLAQYL